MEKFLYVVSSLFLFISFLVIRKYDKRVSIVREVIYAICLLVCYNVVVVNFLSYLDLGGSLFNYTLVNFLISGILFFITVKSGKWQKYSFNKKEFIFVVCFTCLLGAVSYYKSDGNNKINYLTNPDSAVHYKSALAFSKELKILNKNNSFDIVFTNFNRMMPISYINGGLFINVFDNMKSYRSFILYDGICFIACSLLFLVTILELFKNKEKGNYLYLLVLGLLYSLAFPFNSFLYGFCYLGLAVMVINLLFLTVYKFKDSFEKYLPEKLIILFIIVFSVFFSYYLFVPSVYLALGIYYIMLWKRKKINFKEMFLYGFITLILPFSVGFCYFIIPFFSAGNTVQGVMSLTGACYDNVTPIILYAVMTLYLVIKIYHGELKFNYLNLAFVIHTIYIMIFLVLYCFRKIELYYLYKLFFVYWVYVVIYVGKIFLDKKKWLFSIGAFILGLAVISRILISTKYMPYLVEFDIYNYNILNFNLNLFKRDELVLAEESIKYRDMCGYKNTFPMIGSKHKNYWYYAVTNSIPVIIGDIKSIRSLMDSNSNTLLYFDYLPDYKCVVYYNEGNDITFDDSQYDVLFENESGVILKRNDEMQKWLEDIINKNNT